MMNPATKISGRSGKTNHGMCIITTFHDIGDTCDSSEGEVIADHASNIDHIAIPSNAGRLITR